MFSAPPFFFTLFPVDLKINGVLQGNGNGNDNTYSSLDLFPIFRSTVRAKFVDFFGGKKVAMASQNRRYWW